MTVIAYITEAAVVGKILRHLGLPATPPPLSPARVPEQVELFDDETICGRWSENGQHPRGRGPPPERSGTLLGHDGPEDGDEWAA